MKWNKTIAPLKMHCAPQTLKPGYGSACAASLLMEINKSESAGNASSKLNIPVQNNGVKANALVATGPTFKLINRW